MIKTKGDPMTTLEAANVTERVIREQFGYWRTAPEPTARAAAGTHYVIVGCGTSYYLAQILASSFVLHGISAQAVPGGEWARRRRAYAVSDAGTVVIALSRSGESTETVQAVEVSRVAGIPTIAITCEQNSSIAHVADTVLFAPTHPNEGIVMSVSASLMIILGLRFAGIAVPNEAAREAEALMNAFNAHLPAAIEGRSHFVYLGAGALYGLAEEGALKLQEMSLSYSQAYHPMEYRHGPISLVDGRTFAVLLYSDDTREEEAKLARELTEKGAFVVGFGGPGTLELPVAAPADLRPLVILPALQILGEQVARMKGLDTEAPRHLSKVVVLA